MGKVSIKARRNHQGSRILKDSLKELDLKVSDILDIKIEFEFDKQSILFS